MSVNDVEIRAVLKSKSEQNELYKNPVLDITLPSQVQNISINSINLLYEDELRIANFGVLEDGRTIRVILEGEQTKYKEEAIDGATVIINASLTLDKKAGSSTEQIGLVYTNEKAIHYPENKAQGETSKEINVVSYAGLVTTTTIPNKGIEIINNRTYLFGRKIAGVAGCGEDFVRVVLHEFISFSLFGENAYPVINAVLKIPQINRVGSRLHVEDGDRSGNIQTFYSVAAGNSGAVGVEGVEFARAKSEIIVSRFVEIGISEVGGPGGIKRITGFFGFIEREIVLGIKIGIHAGFGSVDSVVGLTVEKPYVFPFVDSRKKGERVVGVGRTEHFRVEYCFDFAAAKGIYLDDIIGSGIFRVIHKEQISLSENVIRQNVFRHGSLGEFGIIDIHGKNRAVADINEFSFHHFEYHGMIGKFGNYGSVRSVDFGTHYHRLGGLGVSVAVEFGGSRGVINIVVHNVNSAVGLIGAVHVLGDDNLRLSRRNAVGQRNSAHRSLYHFAESVGGGFSGITVHEIKVISVNHRHTAVGGHHVAELRGDGVLLEIFGTAADYYRSGHDYQ